MMNMIAMGGPYGWRMNIGTVVDQAPVYHSCAGYIILGSAHLAKRDSTVSSGLVDTTWEQLRELAGLRLLQQEAHVPTPVPVATSR